MLGENGSRISVDWRVLGFTLIISLVTGILFGLFPALQGSRDDGSDPPVVIINETMAKEYWVRGDDPLNARLVIGRGIMKEFSDEPERQIVGIVGDVRDNALNSDPQPHMYIPQAQVPDPVNALSVRIAPIAWAVRAKVPPYSLRGAIEEQLRQATGLPVSDIRSMGDVVQRSTTRLRLNMQLMTVFGSSALLLAAIGIYGLIAYSVEQRTPEIGVRVALSAEVIRLRRMIVFQGINKSGHFGCVRLARYRANVVPSTSSVWSTPPKQADAP